MFGELGVPTGKPEVTGVGNAMEVAVAEHLESVRSDLVVRRSRPARVFEQYTHLDVFRQFTRSYRTPADELDSLVSDMIKLLPPEESARAAERMGAARAREKANHELVTQLMGAMPEESMLQIDITISSPVLKDRLLVGLSSKWSLRTDRAQDCISQGAKLANMRRGHMPHFAVLTMEPRPTMLKLIAYGSGSVDCVYHTALPALLSAANKLAGEGKTFGTQKELLDRMVAQRRLRSYQDLVTEVLHLPQ